MDTLLERLKQMTPLQRAVYALQETQTRLEALQRRATEPMAIVGMACRFPGEVTDPRSYWRLLCEGVDAIRQTPADRWDADAWYDPDPAAPGKMNTRWGGYLDRIDEFDNHFFGISDREAARIDPQHRMMLELSWEALEDAGLPPSRLRGTKVGVFVGISLSDFAMLLTSDVTQTDAYVAAGTSLCLAANRVSFTFGFQGPSLALDTACSSSLVALHLACQHIRQGECDAALVGGTALLLSPVGTINLTKAGYCAGDGRVRAFDAAASGYVRGEGAGVVVLKPLSAALRDQDLIYAVIRGSAVNQNGTSNGLTAPSRAAQEQVLREAYQRAGVSPGQVQYVETQGTGTRLGDVIEALALGRVLGEGRPAGSRCSIGSVKTNFGHLESAAGMASLIKTALAVQQGQLPPSLHFRTPNPEIPFEHLPLQVQQRLAPWPVADHPRLAGVSALGFGGSNAHVVLEEAPAAPQAAPDRNDQPWALLPLSARTERALQALVERYLQFLRGDPPAWADVCYTAARRRDHHDCRLILLADSAAQAATLLEQFVGGRSDAELPVNVGWVSDPTLVGSESQPTGRVGSESQPTDLFSGRKPFGRDLRVALLYGDRADDWRPYVGRLSDLGSALPNVIQDLDAAWARVVGGSLGTLWQQAARWQEPATAGPLLVAGQLLLTAWWRSLGLTPTVVAGQGLGELAAACSAGILSVDEALRLAAAARMAADDVQPKSAVLPFVSLRDGQRHAGPDLGLAHWQACRLPAAAGADVRQTLRPWDVDGYLELGPASAAWSGLDAGAEGGPFALSSFGPMSTQSRLPGEREAVRPPVLPSASGPGAESEVPLRTLGRLYAAGADLAWDRLAPADGQCVRLPTYPWQRQRLWAPRISWANRRPDSAPGTGEPMGTGLSATAEAQQRRARPDLTTPYVAPRNDLEQALAEAWSANLGVEGIGVHDNFLELGGHSLLAAQLLSQLGARLQVDVPLREMFFTPTIAQLARRIEELQAQGPAVRRPPIPRLPREGELPLSLTQESLWFLDQLDRGRPTYTVYPTLRIRGPLDVPAMERALNEIARRHEALRTTFPEQDGRPVQRIAAPQPQPLSLVDLSPLPEAEREAAWQRWLAEELRRPIDLQHGPLIRVTLLRLQPDEHVLVAAAHHIIYDGWSFSIMAREFSTLYWAYHAGQESPLPELPIQYADFAAWQRQYLQGETLEQLRAYWVQQLAGLPALELPTDLPRPPLRTSSGHTLPCDLSRELSLAVHEFCRREGVTPFMVLLAAFQVLLGRYARQEDFAVGSPVANRAHPETQPLIGYFINMLVLRADLSGEPSFRDVVRRVRQVALDGLERQELTLDRVMEAVHPVRDASRHPLFQVMFVLQNNEPPTLDPLGLAIEPLGDWLGGHAALFELTLAFGETDQGFRGSLNFNTDLFATDTIGRMVGHYQRLLQTALAEPDRPLSTVPVMDDQERQQVLVEWNQTATDYSRDLCVHQAFQAQVARTPDVVALVDGPRSWTYRELDQRANQLAHHLRALGVGPDRLVAVRLPRSAEWVQALWGVLKAGGAYVPLDPQLPAERLQFTLQDAQVDVVVTLAALQDDLPGEVVGQAFQPAAAANGGHRVAETGRTWQTGMSAPRGPHVVRLDADAALIARHPVTTPPNTTGSSHLAYVIYTSGSTGRPKGVLIEHRALMNYTQAAIDLYGITSDDRVLQFTSASYDAHVEEVYPCLTRGATLVLRNDDMLDAQRLLQGCAEQRLTFVTLPTGFWHELTLAIETERLTVPASLRMVVIGGERAWPERVAAWLARAGQRVRLVNTYGPTETTVVATGCELGHTDGREARVPIGRPLANLQAYVLDQHRQPVPVGVCGELYLGGDSLARGYLNRPELTAERFVPNPFQPRATGGLTASRSPTSERFVPDPVQPGARLYRTGDLVRWRADGRLDFIGRTDQQVKIRGYRIEPEEVEQVLREHPLLAEAAVVARARTLLLPRTPAEAGRGQAEAAVAARPPAAGDLHLVAYVVSPSQFPPQPDELRRFLAERLPEFMIPSAFVTLEALPTTTSGKLDRRRLPDPDWSLAAAAVAEYVAPRTDPEDQLAGIWAEVLGLERVGVYDDFFERGGNSLLALRLASRIRATFAVDLPLATLFLAPRLADLAERIATLQAAGSPVSAALIPRRPRTGPVPIAIRQESFWTVYKLFPNSPMNHIHAALSVMGVLDFQVLRNTLDEIVRRHELLRTRFVEEPGGQAQLVSTPELTVDLPLDDLAHLSVEEQEAEVRRQARVQASEPFDLSRAPAFRLRLLRLGPTDHVLLATLHHIICDGWSLQVLIHELSQLYEAFSAGRPSPLPELPIQYADYAVWQRERFQGEVLDSQLNYWRQQLAGITSPELPKDRPWRPGPHHIEGLHNFQIAPETRARLEPICRSANVTMFALLLTAFKVLLHRYSGSPDIAVATPSANRSRAETLGVIGPLLNVLCLRSDLSGDPSFRALLPRTRQTVLDAFERQELPFERVHRELAPHGEPTRFPLVQVMFNYHQRATAATLRRPQGIEFGVLPAEPGATAIRRELTFTLTETGRGFNAEIEYDTSLFDPATIERMAGHWRQLLEGICADPDQHLSQLPILTEPERQQLLVDWNRTASEYPRDRSLPDIFEQQAAQTPDAIAAVFQAQRLTYRELNVRANQLAHHLRGLGVQPEQLVGIFVERSLEMVIGLLGILKAGAAYLPLDPECPPERLRYLIDDAGCAAILTLRHLCERLPEVGRPLVSLDTDSGLWTSQSPENPLGLAGAESLAYVMYTSGSTGQPKGVAVCQRAITRLLFGVDYVQLDSQQVLLQLAPLAFDASTFEIWGALLHGGTLVIAPPGPPDFAELEQLISRERITTVWLTASLFNCLLEVRPTALAGVRQLLTGGEALSVPHVRLALERLGPQTTLVNGYGPTETTTFACCYRIPRDLPSAAVSVPIGRPIGNTQAYVLDAALQPVGVGVPGELHLGGDGLARGYWRRPELTAQRFIEHTFVPGTQVRLYRTGDRVRWRADGNLEFLGRLDDQVKLHGYRIELEEIEAVLRQHPEVGNAAVVLAAGAAAEKRLIAHVVPREQRSASSQELRAFLRGRLPRHMVPAGVLFHDALPLTPNGKIDRPALAANADLPADQTTEYVAPRNEIERQLAAIWAEILGLERVGVDDDFFESGGNSLLALRLVPRIRAACDVDLPLATLFLTPRLADVAECIAAIQVGGPATQTVPIRPQPRTGSVPISIGQESFWTVYKLFPNSPVGNIHAAVPVTGVLDFDALSKTLHEMVRRHEILRTGFIEDADGQPRQVPVPELTVDVPLDDLTQLAEEQQEAEVRRLARLHASERFDLRRAPAFRLRLLRLGPTDHVLLATMHHIISDGWSVQVLASEIAQLYEAFCAGRPSPLPELPIQYADFAIWQREYFQGEVLESQLDYWRHKLAGITSPALPTDRPWRPGPHHIEGAHKFQITPEIRARLERVCRSENVTMFALLLTAFKVLLHRCSGSGDIAVAIETANRRRPETQGLIGTFNNVVYLRSDLSGDPSFRALLPRVRQTILEAFERQELPFARIHREIDPHPEPTRFPLVQVMFSYHQRAMAGTLPLPQRLAFGALPAESEPSAIRREMTLTLTETGRGMGGNLAYDTSLFDPATIERMEGHWQQLLDGICADPDQLLSQLPGPPHTPARSASEAVSDVAAQPMSPLPRPPVPPKSLPGAGHSLVPLRTGGAGAPLFCVHGLGGHVAAFMPLAMHLANERSVYGLQAQGLDPGQRPHDRIDTMAAFYADEIRTVQPRGPYLLAGWSLGGWIALEAAQQLTTAGEPVALVALFDTDWAVVDREAPALDDRTVLKWLAPHLNVPWSGLRRLPTDKLWDALAERANLAEGGAADIRRLAEVCKAHLLAAARHRPQPYAGATVLFRPGRGRPDKRWQTQCPQLVVYRVPGDHYSMLRPPHVDAWSEHLVRLLARV